jgi:hypothetical protein
MFRLVVFGGCECLWVEVEKGFVGLEGGKGVRMLLGFFGVGGSRGFLWTKCMKFLIFGLTHDFIFWEGFIIWLGKLLFFIYFYFAC